MANLYQGFFGKIANPNFALTALHGNEPHGEFKAIIRFARPEGRPANLKIMEIHSDDQVKVQIRCDQIHQFVEDRNVLRIDLSEYISQGANYHGESFKD